MSKKPPARKRRRLISRTDLARMAQVSQAAVTKACKGKLAAAVVGDRIDLDHASVQAYLLAHGWTDGDPTRALKKQQKRTPAPTAKRKAEDSAPAAPTPPTPSAPEPVDERRARIDELELLNAEERYRERQIKNDEAEGRLISKEGMRVHVFGALTNLHKRLLEDAPRTLGSRVLSAARSGVSLEQVEAIVVEILSSQLEAARAIIVESLKDDDDPS